jgi:dissimilatory sulfite reductase (desulfoviridin) alpha/beta subunit
MKERDGRKAITILLPSGRLPLEVMQEVTRLAQQFGFEIYLTTMQNLRLRNVPESAVPVIQAAILRLGMEVKKPGQFPLPRVCMGARHCELGVADPELLSEAILERFRIREHTKGKFKIAISGCTLCCSGPKTTDIGIVATREGYEIFLGGKGGPFPLVGKRVERGADRERVLAVIEQVVAFHGKHTRQKQRLCKLLDHPEFPFKEIRGN